MKEINEKHVKKKLLYISKMWFLKQKNKINKINDTTWQNVLILDKEKIK